MTKYAKNGVGGNLAIGFVALQGERWNSHIHVQFFILCNGNGALASNEHIKTLQLLRFLFIQFYCYLLLNRQERLTIM